MNEEEKKAVEKFRKQLRLAINIDDVTTAIRNDNAKTISNLIEKLQNCINILDDELKERDKTINEKEMIIEKLQKENEEYYRQLDLDYTEKNFIPKQRIKEIVDCWNNGDYVFGCEYFLQKLQELLEGRE